ncbi:MAG: 50S ribosomal protein L25 [Candidatus Edwardsbacteria bacterium]|nr:50S ribosomal protein L25 [Candidatus Edwardsbacteria bacterium]
MHEVTLIAHRREEQGKQRAKALRKNGKIPAVVYGQGKPAIPLMFEAKDLLPLFKYASSENVIITLKLAEEKGEIKAIIKEAQTEPIHNVLLHLDLQEIQLKEKIRVKIPLALTGVPDGVKNGGGILEHILDLVEISCLPTDIPDQITLDVQHLKVGQSLHVSDIKLENGEVVSDPSKVITTVIAPLVEAAVAETPATAETAKEPEVIVKGKKDEEAAE